MAWFNPSTWTFVDNVQNKLSQSARALNSFKGSGGNTVKFSNPTGQKLPATNTPYYVPQNVYDTIDALSAQGGGGGYGTGGGGGYAGPSPADIQLTNLRNDATGRLKSILSAYDGLFGGIDTTVRDRTDQLNQSYDQQTQNLNKSFENTQGATGSAYAGRGLGQSSFLGDALGQNADIYNQNTQQLVNDRNNSLAELGRYAATSKAGFNAQKENYNGILGQLGNYDASSLSALIPQLQQAYGNVQAQSAGLGSDQQFIGGLNAITPVINRGADQLKAKLDSLVASGAPKFAKNQIANGVIKQAGILDPTQQNYWQNYWSQLQGQ